MTTIVESVSLLHPEREAKRLGVEHGKATASWTEFDAVSAYAAIQLDNDGDPVFWENYRNPLSGEYADDYLISDLWRYCGIPSDVSDNVDFWGCVQDSVINAYEQAHSDAWHDEIIARAMYYVD